MQIIAPAIIIGIVLGGCTYDAVHDTELWNGQVTNRDNKHVSCEHSYSCNCRTEGSGKNSHEVCDTCYEHAYDVDWFVDTTTGEHYRFDRADRQGLIMPGRYRQAYVGEPFSSAHSFTNYMLVNKNSVLLGGQGDTKRFASLLPTYPTIFNDYRTHHFIVEGGLSMDTQVWDSMLDEVNKTLGPAKQVDILVIVVKTDDPAYVQALKTAWVGGKKNDVIVVFGSLDGHKIEWADVMSWTPRQDLRVELRDQLISIGSLDQRGQIITAIHDAVSSRFERMHMKNYQYLMQGIQFSNAALLSAFLLALALEIGVTWWVVTNNETLAGTGYGRTYSTLRTPRSRNYYR